MGVSGAENGGIAFLAILSRLALFAGAGEIGVWGIWDLGSLGSVTGALQGCHARVSRSEAGQGRGPSVGKSVWKMGGFSDGHKGGVVRC